MQITKAQSSVIYFFKKITLVPKSVKCFPHPPKFRLSQLHVLGCLRAGREEGKEGSRLSVLQNTTRGSMTAQSVLEERSHNLSYLQER